MNRPTYENPNMLPSCNDLLNGIPLRPEMPKEPPLCWTCKNPVAHNGARCLSCQDLTNQPRRSYGMFTPDTNEFRRYEVEYIPRRLSQASNASSNYPSPAANTPLSGSFSQQIYPEVAIRTNEASAYHSSMYHHHPPSPSINIPPPYTYTAISPRTFQDPYSTDMRSISHMPSHTSTAMPWDSSGGRDLIPCRSTKVAATNARHKDSEKKRRDITVSCVAAIEIFTRDVHPGVAAGCHVCIDDEEARKLLPAFEGSYSVDKSKDADGLLNRMKRPKNDKLEESCMNQFLYVLHYHREVYPERVAQLVELRKVQRKEQERGANEAGSSEAKLRKWQGDQRAVQTEKLLEQAKDLARKHGLLLDGEGAAQTNNNKKRKSEEELQHQHKRHISAPTPPSSVNSPRSRRASLASVEEIFPHGT